MANRILSPAEAIKGIEPYINKMLLLVSEEMQAEADRTGNVQRLVVGAFTLNVKPIDHSAITTKDQ